MDSQINLSEFDAITFHFDGNNNDKDDIAALPMAAAIAKSVGLEDKISFFYGNNVSEENNPRQEAAMRESAAFAEKLGIDTYSYQDGLQQTTNELVKILNSGQKVLAIEGGPMETIYRALEQTDPANRGNVVLLSHSSWNENRDNGTRPGGGKPRTWADLRADFPEVQQIDIRDQNNGNKNDRGFNSFKWDWLDSTDNPVLQEAREKMVNADGKVDDPSDAGMLFYAITGQETADPDDAKAFFEANPPSFSDTPAPAPAPMPVPDPSPMPTGDGDVFMAKNGQLVIEAESAAPVGDWKRVTVDGEKGLLWDAARSSYGRVPEGETLSYNFETDEAGAYSIAMHSGRVKSAMNAGDRYENGSSGKERTDTGNDAYVSIVNAETGEVVKRPTKLFTGLGGSNEDLKWGTTFDANHKKSQAKVNLEADTRYRLEITGRSDGYVLDRMTLSNDGFLKDADIAESPVKGSEPAPTPDPMPMPDPTPDPAPEPEPAPEPTPAPEPDPTPDPAPDPTYNQPLITFALIDANSDQLVSGYENLGTDPSIDLSDVDFDKYNIVAQVNPDHPDADKVESVRFNSDFGQRVENVKPYALFGDNTKGDYNGRAFTTGEIALEATAYSKDGGRGEALGSASLDYTIADTASDSGSDMGSDQPNPDKPEGITLAIAADSPESDFEGTAGDDVISIRTTSGKGTSTTAGAGDDRVILYGAEEIPEGNYHEMLDDLKQNPVKTAMDYFGSVHTVDLGSGSTDGDDTLSIISEIDALPKFLLKHTQSNGRINGQGVAGENGKAYDHWAGIFGFIDIENFDPNEDKLQIQGHTTRLGESFTKDGDFFQTVYSEQNANNKSGPRAGAAHDDTFLGLLKFEEGAKSADDIKDAIDLKGMKNYVIRGLGKEVFKGDPTSNQSSDRITDEDILSFSLANSETAEIVNGYENLKNGDEVNLDGLDLDKYTVLAQVNPDHIYADLVDSVKFKSNVGDRIENVEPYTLFSNQGSDYKGKMAETGTISIEATAYSSGNGKGKVIGTNSIEYSMIETSDGSTDAPSNDESEGVTSPLSTVLDLSNLEAYGGKGQNKALTQTLSEKNTAVRLEGNGWRKLGGDYTITPETMLSFEFRSSAEGEIHSIGFDTNNSIRNGDRQTSFQLFGVQDWGNNDFKTYVSGDGWQSFQIPVGEYLAGEKSYLTLGNDHDVANPEAVSEFRNIMLYEAGTGMGDESDGQDYLMSGKTMNQIMASDLMGSKTTSPMMDYDMASMN